MIEVNFPPLPNSNPVPLEDRTGCTWPVTVEGKTLFCNEVPKDGIAIRWCEKHAKQGCSAVKVTLRGKGRR